MAMAIGILIWFVYIACYELASLPCRFHDDGDFYFNYNLQNTNGSYYFKVTNLDTNVSVDHKNCSVRNRTLNCLWRPWKKDEEISVFSSYRSLFQVVDRDNIIWNNTTDNGLYDCFPNPIVRVKFIDGELRWKTGKLYDITDENFKIFRIYNGDRVINNKFYHSSCATWCDITVGNPDTSKSICVKLRIGEFDWEKCVPGVVKSNFKYIEVLLPVAVMTMLVIMALLVVFFKKRWNRGIRHTESDFITPRNAHLSDSSFEGNCYHDYASIDYTDMTIYAKISNNRPSESEFC